MRILGIIPSRYASTRLPAKALADIGGKPMVQRTYEQAIRASLLTEVVVATDHPEIEAAVRGFGGHVVMTSPKHPSGTDRCAEALQKLGGSYDYVINIQGDEPFINPAQIDQLAKLCATRNPELGTLYRQVEASWVLKDPSKVKIVMNRHEQALYFSRQAIPFCRDLPLEEWHTRQPYYHHLGLYAYRTEVLYAITQLPPSGLETTEALEQLRWLEHGYTIHLTEALEDSFSVDTPEDLERARKQALAQ